MSSDMLSDLVESFLRSPRIAVWGVGDGKTDQGAWVARKIRKNGAQVIAVNPAFTDDLGAGRTSSLTRIDPPVDAVLLYVDPPQAMEAVDDALAAGVPLVWLHDAMSPGAATDEAIEKLRASGTKVIPGLCPMLYLKPLDPAHFCLKWILRWKGKVASVEKAARPGDE